MPSSDGNRQQPDRRKIVIPWDLNLHNGNKAAALEAKKIFCARIDAAGRSPSPCGEIIREEAGPDQNRLYDYVPKLNAEPRTKRDDTRHYSKAPIDEEANGIAIHTSVVNGDVTSGSAIIEQHVDEDEDDDLYGMSPHAIVEDSMDEDQNLDTASGKFPIVRNTLAVNGTTSGPKNAAAREQSLGYDESWKAETINVSDDSDSSSGSNTEYTKGATEPIRDEPMQRIAQHRTKRTERASRTSSKASRRSRTDAEMPDVSRIAETPRNAVTSHPVTASELLRNTGQSNLSNLDRIKVNGMQLGNLVPESPTKPQPETIPSTSRPVPYTSSQAQTSGAQYQTPRPARDSGATVVPNTIQPPSLVTSPSKSQPTIVHPHQDVRGPNSDGPTRLVRKRQRSQSKATGSRSGSAVGRNSSPISALEIFDRSEGEEVADTSLHRQESDPVHHDKTSSHLKQSNFNKIMRRTKSDPVSSSAMNKMADYNMFPKGSNGVRKEPKGVSMAKEPQRIFKNLGFFFFPDNDVNQQRFMRIRKAMEYGARFVHPWTTGEGVTHIIVDSDMQYEDVLKHVKLEEIPDDIVVVNQRYPPDCISNQILVDPQQKLYEVIRRRPRANSGKTRQIPQKDLAVVKETPARRSAESNLQKPDVTKVTTMFAPADSRIETEQVQTVSNPALAQQIRTQVEELQEDIAKKRSNVIKATNAIARSNAEWTKEMGIDDPDLINSLRISVKDRRGRYENELAELLRQLEECEKKLAELNGRPLRLGNDYSGSEEHPNVSFAYDDSFYEIIEAAKAAAHLPIDSDSEDEASSISGDYDNDPDKSDDERPAKKAKVAGNSAFQCMEKHDGTSSDSNPNAQTIEILEQMSKYYEGIGDQWRPRAYRMAIKTLNKEPRKIVSKDDAIRLPFVGARLAAKIEEIALTNRLRKLENAQSDPLDKAINIFRGIYGVGLSQASRWANEGYRTLEDVRTNNVKLTGNQRVGIDHYEDLQTRIPRAEVAEHGRIVKDALSQLDPSFQMNIMGSYRRGASNSGDIDIIITKEGVDIQNIRHTVIGKLIPKLLKQNFLTTGLAVGHENSGSKWHGCSCLPGSKIWRRIDFLMVPFDEMGAALIYFTGNDIFNRSMRLLASKKGMRLNQRGLYKNVMRGKGRQKITEGELTEGKDEKKIFEILGVPYRPPEHRIC